MKKKNGVRGKGGWSLPWSGGDGYRERPVVMSGGGKPEGPMRKAGTSSNASPKAAAAIKREEKSSGGC
jgi:hypothetical protein